MDKEILDKMSNEEICVLYQESNDDKLYEYLLNRNYGLMLKFVQKYLSAFPENEDDILSYSKLGFWEAMKYYKIDNKQKAKFTTYCYYPIRKCLNYFFRTKDMIRKPAYIIQKPEVYKDVLEKSKCYSLNLRYELDDDSEHELIEQIEDRDERTEEELYFEESEHKDLRKLLNDKLSPRNEKVMLLWLGLEDGSTHTLQEIGDLFGVTRERIRQVIANSIRKLSHSVDKYFDVNKIVPLDDDRKIYTTKTKYVRKKNE